jgi:hypothetical protein
LLVVNQFGASKCDLENKVQCYGFSGGQLQEIVKSWTKGAQDLRNCMCGAVGVCGGGRGCALAVAGCG